MSKPALSTQTGAAIELLLRPRHVAVIGASRTPGKPGNAAARYIVQGGFEGGISFINPSGGEVEGRACVSSIAQVAGTVDCAFIVLPASLTPRAVADCAAAGVSSVIIGASGFAEAATPEGIARQQEIDAIRAETGIRILGPNTNGILNNHASLALGYNTSHGDPHLAGPVSVVAHSGALFNSFYTPLRERGIGLSKFIPVGNESDLTMLDFFAYLADDPDTRVIALIVESALDGARFREIALQAREAGKYIVALKLGRSKAGAHAALAHSSRLAGSARAFAALARESGVALVPSVEALAATCAILADDARAASGDRRQGLVGVTTSGGGGALLADLAADRGLGFIGDGGVWQGKVADAIEALHDAGAIRNPIDLGNLRDHAQLEGLLAAEELEGGQGPLVAFTHQLPSEQMDLLVANMLTSRRRRTAEPLLVLCPGAMTPSAEIVFRDGGAQIFRDGGTCFDALSATLAARRAPPQPPRHHEADIDLPQIPGDADGLMTEYASAKVLREAGIALVESRLVQDHQAALHAAGNLGYPVVLKAIAPTIAHKAKAGLVATNIAFAEELSLAFQRMQDALRAIEPPAQNVSYLVQPMLKGSAEIILGVEEEAGLGHFLLVGLGGLGAEVLDEVVLFPLPCAPGRIREILGQSKVGTFVAAVGGEQTLRALIEMSARLAAFVAANVERIEAIDLNPLLITREGLVAVDALIVTKEASSTS